MEGYDGGSKDIPVEHVQISAWDTAERDVVEG